MTLSQYFFLASPLPYRTICTKLKSGGWTTLKTDQTPYSYLGTEWISYDDVASVTAKMNIVSARNLAGAFFWSTDQDDYGELRCLMNENIFLMFVLKF